MTPPARKLAALAAALAFPAAAPAAELATRKIRPDGLELVVLTDPAARTVSLRCVVRAGSARDPVGKGGLAHILEHLLLRARGPDGLDLLEAARAAGAELDAYTSRDSTLFVLDAPAQPFPVLAERLLRAITSLRPRPAELDRELAVIQREGEYRSDDAATGLVQDALFRTQPLEGTTLGASASRERTTLEDLVGFYRANYLSPATTIVIAGAMTAADASGLVDRAWLLPPSLEAEWPRPPPAVEPQLPVDERIRAPVLAAVYGYRIDAADRDLCRPLAELLERRFLAVISRRPLVRTVEVECVTLRGVDLVLAYAHARTLDATDLPKVLEGVFGQVASRAADAAERHDVELRMSRIADALRADPAARANEVAWAAARSRETGPTLLPESSARMPVERIRAVARRSFVPQRRVFVFLSPFEG